MEKTVSPYYRQFLTEELARRLEANPRYSLRRYAMALGLGSGPLSRILSGRHSPSVGTLEKMFGALELSAEERQACLQSLLQEKRALGRTRVSPRLRREARHPEALTAEVLRYEELDRDRFRAIADWHHLALWEMVERRDFEPRASWIARRLGISMTEAKLAFDRLRKLDMIRLDGKRWRKTHTRLQTKDLSKTTESHRQRIRQVLALASEAVTSVPYERRHFSGITINIDPARIPELRERMQAALWKIAEELQGSSPKQVYELSLGVFPLEKAEEKES